MASIGGIEMAYADYVNVMTRPSEYVLNLLRAAGISFIVYGEDLFVRPDHVKAAKELFDWDWKHDLRNKN